MNTKHRPSEWGACRSLAISLPLALLTCVAQAGEPGSVERQFLQQATRGDLDNVFLVRMFGGYVALPRTFVVVFPGSSKIRILSDLHKDATLTQSSVDAGTILRTPAGQLEDAASREPLPVNPLRTEQHGRLTVEFFAPIPERPTSLVVIRDSSQYLRLFGSATSLVAELLAAYEALTGPPSVFDKVLRERAARQCQSEVLSFAIESIPRGSGMQVGFRVHPGSDANAFRQTGFLPDDLIIGVDDKPSGAQDLYQLLREVTNGRKVTLSVERGNKRVQVTPTAEAAKIALDRCS